MATLGYRVTRAFREKNKPRKKKKEYLRYVAEKSEIKALIVPKKERIPPPIVRYVKREGGSITVSTSPLIVPPRSPMYLRRISSAVKTKDWLPGRDPNDFLRNIEITPSSLYICGLN